ncbi:chloride channel protein [Streptococcus sp. zg-JUN1979]|uniref:chloride channel protein n=1 Tax=Streptococcus sp. zg-JUN1979 TaxID=3391450 RepID=UPI0039A754F3
MLKLPYKVRLGFGIALTSLAAGLGGILMHELIKGIEWLAYGRASEDFLSLITQTPAKRYVPTLVVMSVLVALIWYLLQQKHAIVSVNLQAKSDKEEHLLPHFWQHLFHTFVQIAFVGSGGPVGKEGAPREFGALCAGRIGHVLHLSVKDRHLLIICGASAGLAAIYHIPLSAFFFAFETFSLAYSLKAISIVLITTYGAAWLATPIVGNGPIYEMQVPSLSLVHLGLLLILPFMVAPLAACFRFLTQKASQYRRVDRSILLCLPLAGLLTALLAVAHPIILGNGSALVQATLDGLSFTEGLYLLLVKGGVVLLCLWAGAYGGTLTPSFAMGGLIGLLLFWLASAFVSVSNPGLLILAGAASFLAITMKAPMTSAGMAVAFTGQSPIVVLPILMCVFISTRFYHYVIK